MFKHEHREEGASDESVVRSHSKFPALPNASIPHALETKATSPTLVSIS